MYCTQLVRTHGVVGLFIHAPCLKLIARGVFQLFLYCDMIRDCAFQLLGLENEADFWPHVLDKMHERNLVWYCLRRAMRAALAGRWRWPQIDAETGERAMAISAKLARIASPHFVADIQSGDWQTQPFMISTHERSGFVILPVEK